MEKNEAIALKKKLDSTVMSISELIKQDLYINVIVSTVMQWLESNDSIIALNEKIKDNVQSRWEFLEKKVIQKLEEYEVYAHTILSSNVNLEGRELNANEIIKSISSNISLAIGGISTTFIAMMCGGAGTALLATGPAGIIMGIIVGIFTFFLGKEQIERTVGNFIADKHIPSLIKKTTKNKIAAELKLNEGKFEQDIYKYLEEKIKPIYEVFDREIKK